MANYVESWHSAQLFQRAGQAAESQAGSCNRVLRAESGCSPAVLFALRSQPVLPDEAEDRLPVAIEPQKAVMLEMVSKAKPRHLQGLAIVIMMRVRFGIAANGTRQTN